MADQNLRVNITAFDKTQRAFASVRAGLGKVKSAVFNVRNSVVALGATLALKQFAGQIDELAKASGRLGLTVNELQSLQFAAGQTGVSSEELTKGLERFSRSIGETANGVGVAVRSFDALGVSVLNTEGKLKPTTELLDDVADALKQVGDPSERVRIAFDLFGRSGVKLINTLKNGSGELKRLQEAFNLVTVELTEEQAQAVQDANDGFATLRKTFGSLGEQITSAVLPALHSIAEFLTISMLKAIIGTIEGVQNLANAYISLANALSPLQALGLKDPIEKLTFGQDAIDNLQSIVDGYEKLSKGIKKGKEDGEDLIVTLSDMQQRGQRSADVVADSFGETFKAISMGTKSASDAFSDMAKTIIARLYDILVVERLVQSISGSLKTMKIFGGTGAPAAPPKPTAIGGSVQRGVPRMVGERGAELFVPASSGSIVPNNKMGGEGVVVNQTINVSTGVSQTVRAEIVQLMPQIVGAAKSGVLDAKKRGGAYGAAF